MTLSIVIPCHNDSTELVATLKSIRATSPDDVEVVVVDDASRLPVVLTDACGQCTLVRTQRRCGVGPARHLGAMRATGEYLLFLDSHMRLPMRWYQATVPHLEPMIIHCNACHDFGREDKPYLDGAVWNFYGPDQTGRRNQIFECVWNTGWHAGPPSFPTCIQAIMGAAYFVNRDWFFNLNPLRFLKFWGQDEAAMSLKCWLAGGECRVLSSHPFAHKFRTGPQIPFTVSAADTVYNKMFLIHTCLPRDRAKVLLGKFSRDRTTREAAERIERDWGLIETEREYNRTLFRVPFDDYLKRFGIHFPAK